MPALNYNGNFVVVPLNSKSSPEKMRKKLFRSFLYYHTVRLSVRPSSICSGSGIILCGNFNIKSKSGMGPPHGPGLVKEGV